MRSVPAQWFEPTSTTSPNPLFDHFDAAQDECAQENLAEVGISLDDGLDVFAAELDHRARLSTADGCQRGSAGQRVRFAREGTRGVNREQLFLAIDRSHHVHRTRHDDEERHVRVADANERVAHCHGAATAMHCDAVDLRWSELRKKLNVVSNQSRHAASRGEVESSSG